jgi:Raf kinase inhibitor-like YbhB/YbcL family protein
MGFALSDLVLTSPSFENDSPLPFRHSGFGDDLSPGLRWSGVPGQAVSVAVVCHDPDAPFVGSGGTIGIAHWVLYNIPAGVEDLPEGVGGTQYTCGPNQAGDLGYAGPRPPQGHGAHRYYFWLLALGVGPDLEDGLSLPQLLARVEPHVLGLNRLVGTFCAPSA